MRVRRLGRGGPAVSEIGFGAWGIGGPRPGLRAYGPVDDAVSLAALDRALAAGITFYDTSSLYGLGHSERLIGRAFSGRRDQVVIATKAGFDALGRPDFRPDSLRASLEASLRNLGTGHVDLFQLHDPDLAQLRAEPAILAAVEDLRREGKAGRIGVSLKNPLDGIAAIQAFGFEVVQINLNMMDVRAVECGLLDFAASRGVGVVARTPLCFGWLSGTLSADTAFPPDDHRSAWPPAQRAAWSEGAALLLDAVKAEGQTGAQKALRFCLSYAGVSTVIPGLSTPAEVDENAAAGAFGPLPERQRLRIEAINRERSFFVRRGEG